MGTYAGYHVLNFDEASIICFDVTGYNNAITFPAGTNFTIPKTKVITFIVPAVGASTSKTFTDSNGKTWTFTFTNTSGSYVTLGLNIDGIDSIQAQGGGVGAIEGQTWYIYGIKSNADSGAFSGIVFVANPYYGTYGGYSNQTTYCYFYKGKILATSFNQTFYNSVPLNTTIEDWATTYSYISNSAYFDAAIGGIRVSVSGNAALDMGGRVSTGQMSIGQKEELFRYIVQQEDPEPISPDPYNPIPKSATGGAGGDFDFTTSDDIDYPSLPTLSAVSTGFISLWTPSETQMLKLAEYMWNADILTIEFWKKLFVNPLDLIYGLNLIPLDLSAISPSIIDSTQNVVMGLIDTKIAMDHLNTQWIEFDCGSITIDETWGAYLDYDPYTKLEIYLPYCGTHPLKVDDFMPGSISVKYHIDLLTGSCVAMVKSTKSNDHGDVLDSIVYQFMGNCATQVPVTAAQYSDAVRSAISIAASIGSMVAVGVGGAAAAGAAKTAGASTHIGMNTLSRELNLGASAVENVMNLKPSIERSGAIGSSGGMLAVQTPYLILTRPRQARPDSQNVYTGYPSFITETLGDLNGWTIVQAIHLDNIPCTSEELDEIDGLLKAGVIF